MNRSAEPAPDADPRRCERRVPPPPPRRGGRVGRFLRTWSRRLIAAAVGLSLGWTAAGFAADGHDAAGRADADSASAGAKAHSVHVDEGILAAEELRLSPSEAPWLGEVLLAAAGLFVIAALAAGVVGKHAASHPPAHGRSDGEAHAAPEPPDAESDAGGAAHAG